MDWIPLDLNNIPTEPGVYGFKLENTWLYIGKAENLKRRLNKQHVPLQIASGLNASLFYCLSSSIHRLENKLIEKYTPTWNGKTSRTGNRYPCCDLPDDFIISPEDRKKAISVIGF